MSPIEHAELHQWELKEQIAKHVIRAFDFRNAGEYVKEGEETTEVYKLICEIKSKEPFMSNR